jgi:hypothetical protein
MNGARLHQQLREWKREPKIYGAGIVGMMSILCQKFFYVGNKHRQVGFAQVLPVIGKRAVKAGAFERGPHFGHELTNFRRLQ